LGARDEKGWRFLDFNVAVHEAPLPPGIVIMVR